MGILENDSLFAKVSKCEFGVTTFLYLGHIISSTRVSVKPEKIKVILDWPPPTNLTQLKGFFELYSFYRRFVKKNSQSAAHLQI